MAGKASMSFIKAVKAGGKVSTKKLPQNKYVRSVLLDGKIYKDRIRTKKK